MKNLESMSDCVSFTVHLSLHQLPVLYDYDPSFRPFFSIGVGIDSLSLP